MASKETTKVEKSDSTPSCTEEEAKKKRDYSLLPWFCLVAVLTAVCLWPMLKNEFTNWDDEFM
jgi:hypothetical protein